MPRVEETECSEASSVEDVPLTYKSLMKGIKTQMKRLNKSIEKLEVQVEELTEEQGATRLEMESRRELRGAGRDDEGQKFFVYTHHGR